MKNGFTLIELLVVVLIIGILAAIALPQYQRTVEKSRFSTVMNMTKALKDAQERHFLSQGKYATDFSELDIEIPSTAVITRQESLTSAVLDNNQTYIMEDNRLVAGYLMKNNKYYIIFQLYYTRTNSSRKGRTRCVAFDESGETGKSICKGLGGTVDQNNAVSDSGQRFTSYYL